MTALAPVLQRFFTDRLIRQRQASPHTVASYRDTFSLLLRFTQSRTGIPPHRLDITDLNTELITAFLQHLEQQRTNSIATRNTRLAAIHSLFRYAAQHIPEHADHIGRVLSIPPKRHDRTIVCFLTNEETQALLAAHDRATRLGRSDHTLLRLACQTGLRVSELISLTRDDIHLDTGAHVRCHGKGRKDRATPITRPTAAALRAWTTETGGRPTDPVFTTRQGHRLSTDAVARLVTKHAATAAISAPTITGKRVTPHTLRHTAAMALLHSGTDTAVIALWLGHESPATTQIYLHADMTLKEQALARVQPINTSPGRYHPPDQLLAFLEEL